MNCPECKRPFNGDFCAHCGFTTGAGEKTGQSTARLVGPLPIGSKLGHGRYEIIRELGSGGMARTYQAFDRKLNQSCVVKEFDCELGNLKGTALELAKKGFEFEAHVLARLRHENMPKVWDYFAEYDRQYLVCELIDGQNLGELSNNLGKNLEEKLLIDAALAVLSVLKYVHRQDPAVIHRDIKPENIMRDRDGKFYLIDFGAARDYVEGKKETIAFGTKGYAAPEAEGSQSVPKSDLYSLGMTLYVLATGQPTETLITGSISPAHAVNSKISPHFSAILEKAIQLNVNQRYDAAEMEEVLTALQCENVNCWWCGKSVPPMLKNCSYCGGIIKGPPEIAWESFRGDMVMSGVRNYAVRIDGRVLWTKQGLGETRCVPLIAEKKVFLPVNGGKGLGAFRIEDGSRVWETGLDAEIVKTGIVTGSYLFVPLSNGNLVKVFIGDGRIIEIYAGGPDQVRGTHLASCHGGLICISNEKVTKLNTVDGRMEWVYSHHCPITTPACSVKDLIVSGDDQGNLLGLDVGGKKLWQQKAGNGRVSGAVVFRQGLFFANTYNGETACFEENGTLGWRKSLNAELYSAPCVVGDQVVIVSKANGIMAYQINSGGLAWSSRDVTLALSAPLAFENYLLVFDHAPNNNQILVMDLNGKLRKKIAVPLKNAFPVALYGRYIVAAATDGRIAVLV